jgi:hypothetical protein
MRLCVFPFVYVDPTTRVQTTHTSCTAAGDAEGRAWCSTKTNAGRFHLKGNWGHCPAGRQLHSGSGPGSELQRAAQEEEEEEERRRSLFERDVARQLDEVAAWGAIGGTAGPPECVADCPGIGTVTDHPTLVCFSACAVTHPCVSDCSQSIHILLDSKKSRCGANANEQQQPPPPPPAAGTEVDTEFVSSPASTPPSSPGGSPVAVLPRCLRSCPGFQQVLASQLNCAGLKEWAAIVVGASSASSASSAESFWSLLGDGRRLQDGAHACAATCPDLKGVQTLASRDCSSSAHA